MIQVVTFYATKHNIPLSRIILRLDGLYGNAAVLMDILTSGLAVIVRGKDYDLLDLPQVQARLALPPDEVFTHPETGTCRALFDCPDVPLSPMGPRIRVIIATHATSAHAAPIGITRESTVYELFFTALPQVAFTPADVVDLYLHRGAFEPTLADEDKEQDPDRWVSHTPSGQEFWQIISQWMWNVRLELGHHLHPTPMRITEFAEALASPLPAPIPDPTPEVTYGPPEWARTAREGRFAGTDFTQQPDGTLRCPADHPLYAEARRRERDGTIRVLYAARIADCRGCPLREQCLGHGKETKGPRRVSAVLRPIPALLPPPCRKAPEPPATHPILWGDWSRCQTRRSLINLLRTQTVTITLADAAPASEDASDPVPLTRQQRAHWRLSWAERLERNGYPEHLPSVQMRLFGIPTDFATFLGLPAAA